MLAVLNNKNDSFFLVCDKDKEQEISDLRRAGLLNSNFHILNKGEFEDYIDPQPLIKTLETITPGIDLQAAYIEKHRERGIGTSKIIAKFYHEKSVLNQNPSKPEVAKRIAQYWVENEIPHEFSDIMNDVLNISSA